MRKSWLRSAPYITLLMLLTIVLTAQEKIYDEAFKKAQSGKYSLKSTDSTLLSGSEILPQNTLPEKGKAIFLEAKGKQAILFKNSSPKSKADVAGWLNQNTLAELLEVNYKKKYRDPDQKFYFTHEVWQKVKINGSVYYIDIKPHDALFMEATMEQFDQRMLIMGQYTGYDGAYDLGYPEHFRVLVLNKDNKVVFTSDELPVECNCEFGILPDEVEYYTRQTSDYLEFSIPGMEWNPETKVSREYNYTIRWNGKSLAGEKTFRN